MDLPSIWSVGGPWPMYLSPGCIHNLGCRLLVQPQLVSASQHEEQDRGQHEQLQTDGLDAEGMYCTVLYCTALHPTVLYCTDSHCTVLYCTDLHCTVLYCMHFNIVALGHTVNRMNAITPISH